MDKSIFRINNSNELVEILNIIKKNIKKTNNEKLNKVLKKININNQVISELFKWKKI
jgi:hypothetical protein